MTEIEIPFRPLSARLNCQNDNPSILDMPLGAMSINGMAYYRKMFETKPFIQVVENYQQDFRDGERSRAYLEAEALAKRGFPPCFRIRSALADLNENQRFDLIVHDLQWLRAMYPEQRHKIQSSYGRLLSAGDAWLTTAEYYRSTKNRWEVWILVRELRLTIDQQWECRVLRSKDVKQGAAALGRKLDPVRVETMSHLVDMTRRHGQVKAKGILDRRYAIWRCYEMTGRSPTKAARLFNLTFGPILGSIDKRHADRDAQWIIHNVQAARTKKVEVEVTTYED